MHFILKPTFSDQKEDFLNVSQFSDIIATLDEQNHIFNIENDLLGIKSIFYDDNRLVEK